MGSRSIENATSLERYLNRSVLFIQGIDAGIPKSEVLQALGQVCRAPQQGRIDILTTHDGKMRGTAFLNFHNREDAKAALDKWRFKLELRGRLLRMQFSSDREFKDIIQGPTMARFKIMVRNLPEELDQEVLFDMYSEYGDILQVHVNRDNYGHHYAIIQYVEMASVQAAIRATDGVRVHNQVLGVEQFKPNFSFGPPQRTANQQPQATVATSAVVASNGPSSTSTSGAAAAGGPAARMGAGAAQGMTYAALQQQQEREAAELARQEAAAAAATAAAATENGVGDVYGGRSSDAGGGGGGSGGGALKLAVPSFYAEAASGGGGGNQTGSYASVAGSLHSLLATALNHAHMLEELLCCPITQEPLDDPVLAADGNTYERYAIEEWLQNHDTSPLTNQVLAHKSLTANNLVRKLTEELKGASGRGSAAKATEPIAAPPDSPPAAAAAADPVPAPAESYAPQPVAVSSGVPVPVPIAIPQGAVVHHYETLHLRQEAQQPYNPQQHVQMPYLPEQQQQQQQQQHAAQQQTQQEQQQRQYSAGRQPGAQQHHHQQQQHYNHHHLTQQQHQMQPQQAHYVMAAIPQPMHMPGVPMPLQQMRSAQQQQQQQQGPQQQQQAFALNANAPTFFTYRPMGL